MTFTSWDVVEPDLFFVAADQQHILTEGNIQGAPALVVEILSPSTRRRDLGIKRALFDRGGVREYRVVDPRARTLAGYRRTSDRRLSEVERLSAAAAAVLVTPLLPGFTLEMTQLFR